MTYKLILSALITCMFASASIAQPGSPTITRLSNGLTLITKEDHATELVGIDVWVKAGSSNETTQNNGVAHFIEHLVFASTNKRQPGDMDLEMESLGAILDAHTSADWAHFNTTVSSRYLSQALDVLADAMTNAQFRDSDIEAERPVILDEIAKKQMNPEAMCKDYLACELFGSKCYALPTEGTPESVKSITRQTILDYYKKYYTSGNMAVVLVGDFDPQNAQAMVTKTFQGLNTTPTASSNTSEKTDAALIDKVTKSFKAPFKLTYLAIGFAGPAGNQFEDVCATDVLLTYLGYGYNSWMTTDLIKKQGLANDATTDFLTHKNPALISLIAGTDAGKLDKAKEAIFSKLASVKSQGISDINIMAAKRSLLGQFAFQNETVAGQANAYGFYFAVSDPEFTGRYINCVQSVTNKDIIRVAQKYLDSDYAVIITLDPEQGEAK